MTNRQRGSCGHLTSDERDVDIALSHVLGRRDCIRRNPLSVISRRAGTRDPDTPLPPRAQGRETYARRQGDHDGTGSSCSTAPIPEVPAARWARRGSRSLRRERLRELDLPGLARTWRSRIFVTRIFGCCIFSQVILSPRGTARHRSCAEAIDPPPSNSPLPQRKPWCGA